MAKKSKPSADEQPSPPSRLFDRVLAGQVKESAQQIWLAGMGAFSRAQAEGSKVFEALAKEGATLQRKTQSAAEEKLGEVTSKMSSVADDVQAKAGKHWDKLEGIFEERTAKALNRLGVPSAKEVDVLRARIDELSARLAKMASGKRSVAKKTSLKPAARAASKSASPAAKRSARKSTV